MTNAPPINPLVTEILTRSLTHTTTLPRFVWALKKSKYSIDSHVIVTFSGLMSIEEKRATGILQGGTKAKHGN
jgi:hypothetical protein